MTRKLLTGAITALILSTGCADPVFQPHPSDSASHRSRVVVGHIVISDKMGPAEVVVLADDGELVRLEGDLAIELRRHEGRRVVITGYPFDDGSMEIDDYQLVTES